MPALTEEQKKKIAGYKAKIKPVTMGEYGARKRGKAAVPYSEEAKRIQANQPSVTDIAQKGAEVFNEKMVNPLIEPFKPYSQLAKKVGKAVIDPVTKQREYLSLSKQGLSHEDIMKMSPEERSINTLQGTPSPRSTIKSEPSASDTGQEEQIPTVAAHTPGLAQQQGVPTQEQIPTVAAHTPGLAQQQGVPRRRITASNTGTGEQQIAGYTVSGMSPEEQERFGAPVARPATRAERGLIPVGPNNSGRGYGARQLTGPSPDREIEPPRSIGDMFRYRREVRERDKNRALELAREQGTAASQQATTEQAQKEREFAAEQEQAGYERATSEADRAKLQSLQAEFANPETTDERRSMIEREIGVMQGRPSAQPRPGKSLEMTENQRANLDIKLRKEYDELAKKEGGFLGFGGEKPPYEEWLAQRHPDLAEQFGGKSETPGENEPITREKFDALKSGDTYIGADGRKYRKP